MQYIIVYPPKSCFPWHIFMQKKKMRCCLFFSKADFKNSAAFGIAVFERKKLVATTRWLDSKTFESRIRVLQIIRRTKCACQALRFLGDRT